MLLHKKVRISLLVQRKYLGAFHSDPEADLKVLCEQQNMFIIILFLMNFFY